MSESLTCPLCLSPVEKFCDSHIVPEFCYRPIYASEGEHRAIAVRASRGKLTGQPIQKGIRERLLCQRCDNELFGAKIEAPFKQWWFDSGILPENVSGPAVIVRTDEPQPFQVASSFYRLACPSVAGLWQARGSWTLRRKNPEDAAGRQRGRRNGLPHFWASTGEGEQDDRLRLGYSANARRAILARATVSHVLCRVRVVLFHNRPSGASTGQPCQTSIQGRRLHVDRGVSP